MDHRLIEGLMERIAPVIKDYVAASSDALRKELGVNRAEIDEAIQRKITEAVAALPPPAPGRDGEPGLDGKDGAPGERGERGEPGLDGKDGAPGERGEKGEPGLDGKDGAPGERGEKGESGKDAEVDYTKIQQWIADELQAAVGELPPAPAGKDGAPGEKGAPGERGEQGEPGKDAVIDSDAVQAFVQRAVSDIMELPDDLNAMVTKSIRMVAEAPSLESLRVPVVGAPPAPPVMVISQADRPAQQRSAFQEMTELTDAEGRVNRVEIKDKDSSGNIIATRMVDINKRMGKN